VSRATATGQVCSYDRMAEGYLTTLFGIKNLLST
jgi:hypothetical protein